MRLALLLVGLLMGMNAFAQEADQTCTETKPFVAPQTLWTGKFVYKASYKVRAGRAESVDVDTFRGADRDTNSTVRKALEKHIVENYRCSGPDRRVEEYLAINLPHDVPELGERLYEARARVTAWRTAAKAASAALTAPNPAVPVCTSNQSQKTTLLKISSPAEFIFHEVLEIRDGVIDVVDVKLMQGGQDRRTNQMVVDWEISRIRENLRCEGTAIFELESTLKLN